MIVFIFDVKENIHADKLTGKNNHDVYELICFFSEFKTVYQHPSLIRLINYRKIALISKYSVFMVGTRRIISIFMSKKFSVPLPSESVTSGQAGGVFRQLFLQCRLRCILQIVHIFTLFYITFL